jgi:hypothetical protein
MVTLESLDKKIDYMIDVFDRKFNSLENKFDEKIDDFSAMCAREFTSIENRLDTIEENSFAQTD